MLQLPEEAYELLKEMRACQDPERKEELLAEINKIYEEARKGLPFD